MLRGERLHGADGLAVVAELSVVVVLDHQSTGGEGPLDRSHAPRRRQRHPERELVGRRQQQRRRVITVDHRPVFIDGQRHRSEPSGGHDRTVLPVAVGLDADCHRALRPQHVAQQRESLGESGAHDDTVGGDTDTSGAGEVVGERPVQLRASARVGVAERVVGRDGQRSAGCGQPRRCAGTSTGRASQGAGRGAAGRRSVRCRRCSVRRADRVGDPRGRPLAGDEPTLGDELAVGVRHRVAGEAQVAGQHA